MSHLTFLYSCVTDDMSVLVSEKVIGVIYVQRHLCYNLIMCNDLSIKHLAAYIFSYLLRFYTSIEIHLSSYTGTFTECLGQNTISVYGGETGNKDDRTRSSLHHSDLIMLDGISFDIFRHSGKARRSTYRLRLYASDFNTLIPV